MSKSNATSKIHRTFSKNGRKVYGRILDYPPIEPGDHGKVEILGRLSAEHYNKTHAFYPAKWGYTWFFPVNEDEFEIMQK